MLMRGSRFDLLTPGLDICLSACVRRDESGASFPASCCPGRVACLAQQVSSIDVQGKYSRSQKVPKTFQNPSHQSKLRSAVYRGIQASKPSTMVQLLPMLVESAFEPFDPRATRLVGVSVSSSGSSDRRHRSLSRTRSILRCHRVEPAFSAKLRRLATAAPLLAPDQHMLGRLILFDVHSNSHVLIGSLARTVLL